MYRCFGSRGVLNRSSRSFILDYFISLTLMIILGVGEVFAAVPDFSLVSSITGFVFPEGLTLDANGNLYVVDATATSSHGVVRVFDASTLLNSPTVPDSGTLGGNLNVPLGLNFDTNRNLYVASAGIFTHSVYVPNSGSITAFNTTVAPVTSNVLTSRLDYGADVVYNTNDQNLYVVNRDSSTVRAFTVAGVPVTLPINSFSGLNKPTSITIDGNGNFYVVNAGINSAPYAGLGFISVFDRLGAATGTPISGLNNPIGSAIDATQGNLYVALGDDNTINVYNKNNGALIKSFNGGAGNQFNTPNYVTLSSDGKYMYVTDAANRCVKIYSISYLQPAPAPFIPPAPPGFMPPPETPPGKVIKNLTPPQMTNLVDSTVGAASNRAGIASGVSNTIALLIPSAVTVALNNIVNAGEMAPGAFRSFTPSQRHALKRLKQQLPMLQFQSLQSMVEPITGPVSNPISATPFDQTKSTIAPLFLSNDNNHVWVQPYAGLQRLESYDQVIGYSLKTTGAVMGIGGKLTSNVIMGVVMGGSLNSYNQDRTTGGGGVKNYYGGLYWSYAKPEGGFHTDVSAIVGKSHYTADRNISALGLVAKSAHDGWDASGRVQTGYKLMFGDLSVDPYTSVGARYSYQNSYQETNAYPFNLKMPSSMTKTGIVEIGMKFQHSMAIVESMISPFLSLSALRLHPLSKESQTRVSFADGGNGFAVPMSTQVKTYATATIGCASILASNVSLSTLVTGKIRKHEKSVEALVKVSYTF